VKLSVEPPEVTAGDEVACRAEVKEADPRVQGGRVELGYENTYLVVAIDAQGVQRDRWRSNWVPAQTVPLFAGAPPQGPQVVHLRVPEDGPPTVAGTVEWQVRAIVDRHRGLDARAKVPLVVRAAQGALAYRTRSPAESSTGTKVAIAVDLATRELHPGGTLTGIVTANPAVYLDLCGLRVQLARTQIGENRTVRRCVETKVPLVEELTLEPGKPVSVPFEIALAADASPCFEARYNMQRWWLEAVIDIPLGRDYVTRIELLVT